MSGLAILTLGASLAIKAKLGAGPWDSLNVGLAEMYGLTVGIWSIIIGVVLIFINAAIAWRLPDLGGLVTITVSGLFIDFWLISVLAGFEPHSLVAKFITLGIGITLIAVGIATYLQAKWSPSPVDDLMVALHTRFHVSLGVAKTIAEVLALTLAILMKGPVGIGTVVIAIGLGPLVAIFHRAWEKRNQSR